VTTVTLTRFLIALRRACELKYDTEAEARAHFDALVLVLAHAAADPQHADSVLRPEHREE